MRWRSLYLELPIGVYPAAIFLQTLLYSGFSLTYIPFSKIVFSIITVTISSYLIDRVQSFKLCTQFKGENKGERMVLPSKILDEKE